VARVAVAVGTVLVAGAVVTALITPGEVAALGRFLGGLVSSSASPPAPVAPRVEQAAGAPAKAVPPAPAPRPAEPAVTPPAPVADTPRAAPVPTASPSAPTERPSVQSPPSLPEPPGGRGSLGLAKPSASVGQRAADVPAKPTGQRVSEVVVKPGDILSQLAAAHYGRADATILDFVKGANPGVENIDVLVVGQRLRFPPFEPRALVHRVDDSVYRLHVVTLWGTQTPTLQKLQGAANGAGRKLYIVPVALSLSETAYRVMVGPFDDRREAEAFYRNVSGILGS
jgi:hypothetical protein